jgi:hypothetical protein
MHHFIVVKSTNDVKNAINCLNMREECVAQTSPGAGTFHQPSNVSDVL